MTIKGSSDKENKEFSYNDFVDNIKGVSIDRKPCTVGLPIMPVFESIVDEEYLNAIKKLEIDIYNLRESLKLSNELNSNYENKIKDLETTIEIIRRENKELKRGVR